MSEHTKIEWCDLTWSPWRGCTKCSPGCANCYAESLSKRNPGVLGRWGKGKPRVRSKSWGKPAGWNRKAKLFMQCKRGCRFFTTQVGLSGCCPKCGHPEADFARPRVFPSLLDWLDDEVPIEWLADFLKLIHDTPNLDWLLLTKRTENWLARVEAALKYMASNKRYPLEVIRWVQDWVQAALGNPSGAAPANVWIGVSVEDQQRADERVPELLRIPARIRFLSVEPLLGPIDLKGWGNQSPSCNSESAPASWSEFAWPEWIPTRLRKNIESFWGPTHGRSPKDWMRDHVVQHVPATGARLTVGVNRHGRGTTDKMATLGATGRYVHHWNNVGSLVCDDGVVIGVGGGSGSGWLSRWLTPSGDYVHKLHWVIIGGESGPRSRPCNIDWVGSVVNQCQGSGVPVFVKQLGSECRDTYDNRERWDSWRDRFHQVTTLADCWVKSKHAKGGNPAEWPADLRVRELPQTT